MEIPLRRPVQPEALPGLLLPRLEPFPEHIHTPPYLEAIAAYAEASFGLHHSPWLLCQAFPSQTGLRTALIGARQTHLPLAASVLIEESGAMPSGGRPLCALIMAEALGVEAFGISCDAASAEAAALLLHEMAAHTDLPLFLQPDDPHAAQVLESALPVTWQNGLAFFSPAPLRTEDYRNWFIVCNESDVFYLDESFELSEPITCELDMSNRLLAAEGERCDTLSIHLSCLEDAYLFARNQHMASLPVSFLAETEEALEAALIRYNGRAIVDSRSVPSPSRLAELAAGYGAVLR